jgi:ligand-binding sensor domain-containing protein
MKELINEWVYGIAVDAKDRVWFGTEGGVSMFDGKAWRSWTHKDGLGAPNRENLPPSANTGLGTRSRHDLSVSTSAESTATYNPNYVFAIVAARDGAVWAGTWGGGAARFDGKAWSNLTAAEGLAGNIVYSIAEQPDGVLWFGTNKGLSRFDGKAWTNFGKREGLLEEHVYAVAIAPNGDVWAGTKRGVARIAK